MAVASSSYHSNLCDDCTITGSGPQHEEAADGSLAAAPQLPAGEVDPDHAAPALETPRGPRPDSATLLSSMGLQEMPPQDGPVGEHAPRARPLSARVRTSRCVCCDRGLLFGAKVATCVDATIGLCTDPSKVI